jgi:hypothetical protein
MTRGRPVQSQIRQNIIEILNIIKHGYGYNIYKAYVKIFPAVTMRSIYYHLKKGVALEEFKVHKIEKEQGDYSWGSVAEKIYYSLGPQAKPKLDKRVVDFFEKKK